MATVCRGNHTQGILSELAAAAVPHAQRGMLCAMVLLGNPDSGPFTPVAVWPDARLNLQHLIGAAECSLKERSGLLVEKDTDPASKNHFPENFHIAYPIEVAGKIHGTIVLGVKEHDRNVVQKIMRQLHPRRFYVRRSTQEHQGHYKTDRR